ncbi:MAG: beta-ketoacyl synthase chain length factor [Kiritimatiellia bacterium]
MTYRIEYAVWRATDAAPKPDVSFVPPMERRRLTGVERAALATAWQVKGEGAHPVVFASRWGEIGVTAKLMRQFHADGEMSPAGFSASVHNAAPGVFSLLTRNHAPYTAIAACARSLEMGVLEALALRDEVVCVYAEEATPDLYAGAFEDVQAGCSVALRLTPCAEGDVAAAYRHEARPPASFDQLVDFLEGRAPSFAAADFVLTRVR